MGMISTNTLKQYLGEKVFHRGLEYLEKDPCGNVVNIMDLLCKAPISPHHKKQIEEVKEAFINDPVKKEYITKIFNQVSKNVLRAGSVNFFLNAIFVGIPKKMELSKKLGFNIPFTILLDPTSKCNLNCRGCWAGKYDKHDVLSYEEVDRILSESKELGMYFIVMSGGEPFLWPHLFEICEKHNDMAFMIYTNGTTINEKTAQKMEELGNMSPVISVEGNRETTDDRRGDGVFDRIVESMDHLRNAGVPFGCSITITRNNCDHVFSDEYIDFLIEKGVLYGWSFHYIPVGKDPDFSLMITPEQRKSLVGKVREIRKEKPIMLADFWNDGYVVEGCIAGGRQYFHITASGAVEPCAFVHFSIENIKEKSLKEVLQSPIFEAYQKRQPFSNNYLRPCPLIDVPECLREIVKESGAVPTYEGADAILNADKAAKMDQIAYEWKLEAEKLAQQKGEYKES